MRHISAVVSFLIIVTRCGSVASDETKANHCVEIWREYSFDENETEFDTTLVKGTITKKVQYNGDAGIMSSTKFSVSPDTIKKVTIYDSNGNLKTVETYYGKSDTNGIIEEITMIPEGIQLRSWLVILKLASEQFLLNLIL
ncbi:MAG TPA: hypothetical protein VD884_02560 [Ohtaekwangia sp.]|nr:hypothetical protein [Ohtaekwangia sp.]